MPRRVVPAQAARAQAKPWLVARVPEDVGRAVWDRICDVKYAERLTLKERTLEAQMDLEVRYSFDWWRLLRKLDRLHQERLAVERRLG